MNTGRPRSWGSSAPPASLFILQSFKRPGRRALSLAEDMWSICIRPSVKYNVTKPGQGIAKVPSRGMVINMPVNPVAIEELMKDRKLAVLATGQGRSLALDRYYL